MTIAGTLSSPCGARRSVGDAVTTGCARGPGGRQWRESTITIDPLLRGYADWLQTEAYVDRPITLRFVPGRLIGQTEDWCPYGPDGSLKPGQSRTGELLWDGHAAFRLGPPPSSPAVITAKFDHWYRDSNKAAGTHRKPIVVKLDSWVIGGSAPGFLSPKEAIDAALADPVFGPWARTQPFNLRRTGVVEYDPALDVWIVGLIHEKDHPAPSLLRAALVDPLTGVVLTIREFDAYRWVTRLLIGRHRDHRASRPPAESRYHPRHMQTA